jgi:hypothetical protein
VDTSYPVRWVDWTTSGRRRPQTSNTLSEVLALTTRTDQTARPVRTSDRTSPWLTGSTEELPGLKESSGKSDYRAYAGSFTGGLNGAYWIEVLATRTDGSLLIRNLNDVGRIAVDRVECTVESELVYPLLRGRDVERWRARPSASIVLAQNPETRSGFDTGWMRENLPLTFDYLSRFKEQLLARKSGVVRDLMAKGAFYTMYAIGPYTVALWKVVWREQASAMTAAVCGPIDGRPVIPDHKLMSVPVESADEADYLCAILNSPQVAAIVAGYTISVSISTHVLEHVRVARFEPTNELHLRIAEFGRMARETGVADNDALGELVARLWVLAEGSRPQS